MHKTQPWLWNKRTVQVKSSFGADEVPCSYIAVCGSLHAKIIKWHFFSCLCSVPLNQAVIIIGRVVLLSPLCMNSNRHNGRGDPATLSPRDIMHSKRSRIQSSLCCLSLPTIFTIIFHFTKKCFSADIAPSMEWPRIDLDRKKETGFNNHASQNDPSRKVTTAVNARRHIAWNFRTQQGKLTILPLAFVLKVGKGPEMSSAPSLSDCTATLPGAG